VCSLGTAHQDEYELPENSESNDDEQKFRLSYDKRCKNRRGFSSRRKGWKRDMIFLTNERLFEKEWKKSFSRVYNGYYEKQWA